MNTPPGPARALPLSRAPLRSMAGVLPAELTPLVGRERELALGEQLLRRTEVRLLTVTGPGGIGKTRLATEIAHHAAPDFADGVLFVPLATIVDSEGITTAIRRALGLPDAIGVEGTEPLISVLREREALILLDSFEHLLSAAPFVTTLLTACRRLKVVVTSRALLRLAGEYALPAPPLVLPGNHPAASPEEIARSPAVRLFVDRVQAVLPSFALTEQTAPVVAEICRHLDGLPLAIELAAAQTTVLPPAALLARIQARLPLPVPGPRDAPVRLRTIEDAVAWSYDLLDPDEQLLFRQLSIFAGGFTLEAAEAVVSPAALTGIASLVDKNLLQQSSAEGLPRFAMLETIHSFARDQLTAHGEDVTMGDAHASWVLTLAEPAELATAFPGHERLLRHLELEHANLLAALTWLDRQGDVERLSRLSAALGQFWIVNGHVREGREWLERALARAAGAPASLRGRVQASLGRILSQCGEIERADQLMDEGVAALRSDGGPNIVTFALFYHGAVANQLGAYDRAEQLLTEAGELAVTIDDPIIAATATAAVLANHGVTAHGRGDLALARTRYEQALDLYRQTGFTFGIMRSLRDLGDVDRDLGEFEHSVARYLACLEVMGNEINSRIVIDALEGIALAAAAWRQPVQAARLLGAAELLQEQHGGTFIVATDRDAHERALSAIRSVLSEPELVEAMDAGRQLVITEAIAEARALHPGVHRGGSSDPPAINVSPRERDVLRLLVAGYSDRAIADALFISVRTVEAHVARILAKFDVRSRSAAASAALAMGIIEPAAETAPSD